MSKSAVCLSLLLTAALMLATVSSSSIALSSSSSVDNGSPASRFDASRDSKHFTIDARDVLADPRAAFASWSAHYSRPAVAAAAAVEEGASSAEEEEKKKKENRGCHRGGRGRGGAESSSGSGSIGSGSSGSSSGSSERDEKERARFDAWASNVLPRARRALETAQGRGRAAGNEPVPLEVNGIADVPLSTLRAGLLPAAASAKNDRDSNDDNGFDGVVRRAMEWVRFPYAAEAFYDALAQKSGFAASSSAEQENEETTTTFSSSSSSSAAASPFLFRRSSKNSNNLHRRHRRRPRPPVEPLPAAVDWSALGVLGPVKNQHVNNTPCGCCWSFATTGVVEGVVGVVVAASSGGRDKTKRLPPPSLSEQQLIDCDRGPPFDDLGCQGGSVEGGVNYIVNNHGRIDTEEDYPYTGVDDQGILACRRKKEEKKSALDGTGARVVGFRSVPRKSESALKAAVARHPVAVAVCCGDFIDDWHAYSGGIMTFNGSIAGCPKPLDHAVVVVGYGEGAADPTDPTGQRRVDYWIVKNSWGEAWGENGGYFKLARGLSGEEFPKGAAGVLSMPNFPVVERVDDGGDGDDDDDVEKDSE